MQMKEKSKIMKRVKCNFKTSYNIKGLIRPIFELGCKYSSFSPVIVFISTLFDLYPFNLLDIFCIIFILISVIIRIRCHCLGLKSNVV